MHPGRCALALGAALLCAASQASANTASCTAPPGGGAAPHATAEQLKAQEAACLHSAAYYRQLAHAWLAQGAALKAQEAFERALLLEPDDLPTQWHYAQTLHLVGDHTSARQLLLQLATTPELPAPLQQAVQAALAAPAPGEQWVHRASLALSAVADSNLNNAALASELTLTFPQGNVTLPVAPDFRRQSGAAGVAQLQWTGLRPHQQQLWLLQADVRHRHTGAASHRYTQAELAATWLQEPDAPSQWLARAQHSQVVWGASSLYSGIRMGLQHQWRLGGQLQPCRLAWGGETEHRSYPAAAALNGRYLGSVVSLACQNGATHPQWQLQWRIGLDEPGLASRPGGRYRQQDWRLAWNGPLGHGHLLLDYHFATQVDSTGYSPLLSTNAVRRQRRNAVGVEYAQHLPLGPGWQWFMAIEASRQGSNLAVFTASRQAVSVGLRWSSP